MLDQLISQLALILLITTPQTAAFISHPLPDESSKVGIHILQLRSTQRRQVDNPAVPRNRIQIRSKSIRTDKVHNDVHTFPICRLQHLFVPLGRLGIIRRFGTQLFHTKVGLVI